MAGGGRRGANQGNHLRRWAYVQDNPADGQVSPRRWHRIRSNIEPAPSELTFRLRRFGIEIKQTIEPISWIPKNEDRANQLQ
jgi:hypothetical protein